MEEPKPKKLKFDSKVDRLSLLPEPILHRILFRYGLKTAAKTCVLSKAWRYFWCTNPRLLFHEDEKTSLSLSVIDKILQTYLDGRYPLHGFSLLTSEDNYKVHDPNTGPLMNKWIPILVQDMGVVSLDLCFRNSRLAPQVLIELPSLIFESPNIKNLTLALCSFTSTAHVRVDLNRLETLSLYNVSFPERILDNILSSCPFLRYVTLRGCKGLTGSFKLMNNRLTKLTAFSFHANDEDRDDDVSIEIGNAIQTLTSIDLDRCSFSVSLDMPLEYARLRRLSLRRVKFSSGLGLLSCNLHSLEELRLDQCKGIKEFNLSSRSMKRLSIHNISKPFRVTVDAPSMVGFNYDGVPPQSISFAGHKNSSNYEGLWKSKINLEASPSDRHPSHSFNELCGLIKAVSQISEVYLELDQVEIRRLCRQVPIIGDSEPVAVEHLTIKKPENNRHPSAVPFLNRLFHMFRPSFIYQALWLHSTPRVRMSRVEISL